jgi:hypothetical protein
MQTLQRGRDPAAIHPANHCFEPPRSMMAEITVGCHVDNVIIC